MKPTYVAEVEINFLMMMMMVMMMMMMVMMMDDDDGDDDDTMTMTTMMMMMMMMFKSWSCQLLKKENCSCHVYGRARKTGQGIVH